MTPTGAENALNRMQARLAWLYNEVTRQRRLGNWDTADRYEAVARAAAEILESLAIYVSRNPSASTRDLLEILENFAATE